jgi:hypothetical protein
MVDRRSSAQAQSYSWTDLAVRLAETQPPTSAGGS